MNAILITVRTASTRLPKKCLMDVEGRMAIERVIDRAKLSELSDSVILCTTYKPEDTILCEIAELNEIKYYRGSTEDKLMRWQGATLGYDFFVTADGDDLLCDPELMDLAFEQSKNGADFIESPDVPCGAFTYGIRVSALNKVCEIKNTYDTEMIVPYFKDTNLFNIESLIVPEVLKRPEIRMTLDYEDDLRFFREIYKHFEADSKLEDIIEYLDLFPEVVEINSYLHSQWKTNQLTKTHLELKSESIQVPR